MRLQKTLLKLPRQYSAETLAAEIAALPPGAWIPHPGKLPGNDAVPLITPAGQITNAFIGPMAPTQHLLNCPYILEIMADLGGVWGRSRLMGLAPGADVPGHVDVGYYWRTHLRVHIPIVTTPNVTFTCGDDTVHMAPGECWVFNSFRMHNVRNGGTEKRIHLVLDTVGSERIWDLVDEAQRAELAGSEAPTRVVAPGETPTDAIAYEQLNTPDIMSGWEVRCHIDFLLGEAAGGPELDAVAARLDRFVHGWAAAWAQFGGAPAGVPTYRRLIETIRADLRQLRADALLLPNQVPLERALNEIIFQVAVPAPRPQMVVAAAR